MDNRSFENTLKAINVIIEQLLKFQEIMQKKDLSELRTIAEGIFNINNASFYNKEELIVEIIKARAKMLEPKKKKKKNKNKNKKRRRIRIRIRSAEEKESIRRIDRRGLNFPFFFFIYRVLKIKLKIN